MGISGLLPLLKSIHKPCNLKQFTGQTIGVDAYGWLHRGTVSCAPEIALDKPTTKFVDFAMSRVRMLKHFGITPYIVFDGDYLPSKAKTEKERAARRRESKRVGMQLLELGKTAQAYLELQKAVDVTPEMAGQFIEQLKIANVQYVVAPYEADSQLAYLEQKGIIDGILSEDSDLLVFGAKRLLTKLDQYGECVLIRRDDFTACREVSLVGWSDQEFRRMAILSGCDYLANIDKMGLKTAYRLIRKHKSIDRVIRAIQFDGKFKVPADYLESFLQAEMTFLHQWVFCPVQNCLVNCTPLQPGRYANDLPYIGEFVEASVAAGVASGELHPHTKEPLQVPTNARIKMFPPTKKQSLEETPDLKKNKSIDSFFKPKRTPLAELDPNSFASSPSQDQLIRRASGSSWPATPVPQTIQGSSVRTAMISSSVPMPARRTVSDNPSTQPLSERVPKRKRLCSDGSSPVAAKDASRIESGTSKFFATLSKSATSGRKSKAPADFTLYSDDSIEAALRDLPEPESFTSSKPKSKRVNVYNDASAAVQEVKTVAEKIVESQEDTSQQTTTASIFSQVQDGLTPPSSSESTSKLGEPKKPIFQDYTFAQLEQFSKSAYYAKPQKSPFRSTISRAKSAPSKTTACTRSSKIKPQAFVNATPVVDSSAQSAQICDEGEHHDILTAFDGAADSVSESQIVVPASDPVEPPSPCVPQRRMLGSEDLLLSDSEVEESPQRPTLDLGRFAFGAK